MAILDFLRNKPKLIKDIVPTALMAKYKPKLSECMKG